MNGRKPRLGPVLLTVFLDLIGFGLVIPLLSFYAESYGASALEVTVLMASYSVAQFFGAPLWGALSDRVGRRPVMLVSIALTALFLAGFAAADTLPMLFLFRTLHGLAAANVSTAQAVVADLTHGPDRARGMGLIGAAFGVGFSLGPFLGGQLSPWGLSAPIWAAAALSAINLVWAWRGLPETLPSKVAPEAAGAPGEGVHRRTLDPRAVLRALGHPVVGLAIGLTFLGTFAFSMLEATFALVAEHVWGQTARDVGNLFGIIGLVGIVIQGGLIGRLAARFGEGALLRAGYALNAVGMAMLAVTPPGLGVWAGCTVMAMGVSLTTPSLNSLISRATPAHEQGAVLGANQSLAALARATAPATGGLLYTGWRPTGAFLAGAALLLVAWVASLPATRRAAQAEPLPDPT